MPVISQKCIQPQSHPESSSRPRRLSQRLKARSSCFPYNVEKKRGSLFIEKGQGSAKEKLKITKTANKKQKPIPKLTYAPRAEVLYHVTRDGTADLRPISVGSHPWESLHRVSSASLPGWTVHCGDIVIVNIGENREDFAKVCDLRRLSDGRYVVVYAWLYTRQEVCQEAQVDGKLAIRSKAHIDEMWPLNASHRFLLSTNRTITMWDTAIAKAPERITAGVCKYAIYSTTVNSRRIVSVDHHHFKWMKAALEMQPT